MLTRFPLSTPPGLDLGTDPPRADRHGSGTLRLTVTGVFTLFLAYLIRHPHFPPLHRKASAPASLLWERSPTPPACAGRPSFGGRLEVPTIIGAATLDW